MTNLTRIRRTGITLREGKRDEHGMEEIEGMFSSPERSPAPVDMNGTVGSGGMSTDESKVSPNARSSDRHAYRASR